MKEDFAEGNISKAVFRGRFNGKSCLHDGIISQVKNEECGRRKLLQLSAKRRDLFDVKLNDCIHLNNFAHYKADMIIEGHCGWSDRQLFTSYLNSVIVKQKSFCRLWFEDGLVAWRDYVPVDYRLDNLEANTEFILSNDGYRRNMIRNMRNFAEEVLKQESMSIFLELLIKEFELNRRADDGWKEVKVEEGMMDIDAYIEKFKEEERLDLGNRTTGL